jgi:hypothetical protein
MSHNTREIIMKLLAKLGLKGSCALSLSLSLSNGMMIFYFF